MSLINVDVTNALCRYCGMPSNDVKDMREHVTQHGFAFDANHPDGVLPFSLDKDLWQCVICQEKFNNFLKLYEHMNVHYQHYICATCGKGYMTAPRLRKHAESHVSGTFPCNECGRVFNMRAARDHHKANAHAKAPRYECPHCNMRFAGYYHRMNHLNEAHRVKEVSYRCAHCELSFKTSGKRAIHVRTVHFPPQRDFACSYCEWHFKTSYELKRHMVKHTGERNYHCNVCGKSFPRHRALRAHEKTHEDLHWSEDEETDAEGQKNTINVKWIKKRRGVNERKANAALILENSNAVVFRWKRGKFMCAYCPALCPNARDLRAHADTHSNKIDVLEKPELRVTFPLKIEISDLICTVCNTNVESLKELKTHLATAHSMNMNPGYSDGVIPFVLTGKECRCVQCELLFENFMTLFIHTNEHYQSYVCMTCGKGFSSENKLRSHRIKHEIGEYACSKCNLVFSNRGVKNRHVIVSHGPKKRYRCPICNEYFDSYHARLRHLDRVHGQKAEYKCSLCPSVFATGTLRYGHIRSVHKGIQNK